MKYFRTRCIILLALCITLTNCKTSQSTTYRLTKNYKPDDQNLYNAIVQLDSIFFDAYNNCNSKIDLYGSFFSENIEFYHDKGGLMTDKQDIISATQKNICGKVTRELVKGSIEVYPIKNFGAVQIGLHLFHNNQDPINTLSKPGRFMVVWENKDNKWLIKRVVSLH